MSSCYQELVADHNGVSREAVWITGRREAARSSCAAVVRQQRTARWRREGQYCRKRLFSSLFYCSFWFRSAELRRINSFHGRKYGTFRVPPAIPALTLVFPLPLSRVQVHPDSALAPQHRFRRGRKNAKTFVVSIRTKYSPVAVRGCSKHRAIFRIACLLYGAKKLTFRIAARHFFQLSLSNPLLNFQGFGPCHRAGSKLPGTGRWLLRALVNFQVSASAYLILKRRIRAAT